MSKKLSNRLAVFGTVCLLAGGGGAYGLIHGLPSAPPIWSQDHARTEVAAPARNRTQVKARASAANKPPTPAEIALIVAEKMRQFKADNPQLNDTLAKQQRAEEMLVQAQEQQALARSALVAALATGAASNLAKDELRRRMNAGLLTGRLQSAEPGQPEVAVAIVEEDIQLQADGDEIAETQEVAVAVLETLPEAVPLPSKRPAVPRTQVASKPVKAKAATLAYASAEDPTNEKGGVFSGLSKVFSTSGKVRMPGRGSGIAVYDISAATVHMPDGTKLRAHSGIGKMRDNPRYTKVRNNGPTPPNIYTLRMRESLFYGVEAIRMTPLDRAAMHGRDGMLTHTNLLRGQIGSHGCVAFKDYAKFLKAFKAGKVRKMIVVPQIEELPTYMAAL
ncbi:DUF2778 domain-containing protein [Roseibium algae]|uniref:DUF2778 domain-containing protein n=1 Tax=Roseibium algae TaxID=3123038 RepID=A0ABU8TH36_9HYPH